MRKTLGSILLTTIALVFAACSKNSTVPANSSSVMYVNGCMGTSQGLTVKVSSKNVTNGSGIGFCKNSGYQYVTAGTGVNTAFFLPDGTPLINQGVDMTVNAHYSVFAGGQITAPTFLSLADDLTVTAGKAKIRFVNLSPDSLNISASASTIVYATGITSLTASPFVEVTAGTYDLKAVDPADATVALFAGAQQLNTGKVYTLMLTGSVTATGVSVRKLTLINNN